MPTSHSKHHCKKCQLFPLLPPKIKVCEGEQVKLVVVLKIWPQPCIQWQVSKDGGCIWTNLPGKTNSQLVFIANRNQNGNRYRAIIQTKCECLITNEAKLKVGFIELTQNPSSVLFMNGVNAVFTAAAEGRPTPTVQWQVSTDLGVTFTNIPGATSPTLTVLMNANTACNQYRAVFTNECGTVTSEPAAISALLSALGVDGAMGSLMIIDPNTGALLRSFPSPIGFAVTGLAINPLTGRLYGVTSNQDPSDPSLIEINRQTGVGTLIAPFPGNEIISDISFRSDGTLYGWTTRLSTPASDLVTIDLTTGAVTPVGDSGLSTAGAGLSFVPNGTLYLFAFETSLADDFVWPIDPDTGLPGPAIPINVPMNFIAGGAMASDFNGVLYALIRDGSQPSPRRLVTLDLINGAGVDKGMVNLNTDALVFC